MSVSILSTDLIVPRGQSKISAGPMTIFTPPVDPLDVVNKKYVDDQISAIPPPPSIPIVDQSANWIDVNWVNLGDAPITGETIPTDMKLKITYFFDNQLVFLQVTPGEFPAYSAGASFHWSFDLDPLLPEYFEVDPANKQTLCIGTYFVGPDIDITHPVVVTASVLPDLISGETKIEIVGESSWDYVAPSTVAKLGNRFGFQFILHTAVPPPPPDGGA